MIEMADKTKNYIQILILIPFILSYIKVLYECLKLYWNLPGYIHVSLVVLLFIVSILKLKNDKTVN